MKWLMLFVLIAAIAAGCSNRGANSGNDGLPPEIAKALEEVAREQGQGLKNAQVIVHRAYDYKGNSAIEPEADSKLIAVDVEFRNYSQQFDLDDVDIIDGKDNENYGSDPDIGHLTPDGKVVANTDSAWPDNGSPLRVLLIYELPKKSSTIKLSYWGQELTATPIPLAGDGPSLPKEASP